MGSVVETVASELAKEIGGMATVLSGQVDAIILTGGLSHDSRIVKWIEQRVHFIAPVSCLAGEAEMEAMAAGVFRVLNGEEEEKEMPDA